MGPGQLVIIHWEQVFHFQILLGGVVLEVAGPVALPQNVGGLQVEDVRLVVHHSLFNWKNIEC
jgi:hypothetical protein